MVDFFFTLLTVLQRLYVRAGPVLSYSQWHTSEEPLLLDRGDADTAIGQRKPWLYHLSHSLSPLSLTEVLFLMSRPQTSSSWSPQHL